MLKEQKGEHMETLSERFMYYCGVLAGHRDNPKINVDDLKHIQDLIDAEEQGFLIGLPCKVGDVVILYSCCRYVNTHYDKETDRTECPFEYDCEFEGCYVDNDRFFEARVNSIFNNGNGWYITLDGMNLEIPVEHFGKSVFLTQDAAGEALNKRESGREDRRWKEKRYSRGKRE